MQYVCTNYPKSNTCNNKKPKKQNKKKQKTSHPLPHLLYESKQKVKDKHSFMFYRGPLKTIIKNSETKLKHPNHMHT